MAISWQLSGSNQLICAVKQTAAAAETISFDVNDKQAFSILGGYITVIATGGAATTCKIKIGATEIASQSAQVVGTYFLPMDATSSKFNGNAGDDVSIVTSGASDKVQVTLFISQASPATLA